MPIKTNAMNDEPWQFWIDVGGTFTDCFGLRPGREMLRCKVLSSGITKGQISQVLDGRRAILDDRRRGEPNGYWDNYQCRLIDAHGRALAELPVAEFDGRSGTLHFTTALPDDVEHCRTYELTACEEAPLLAIRKLLQLRLRDPLPPSILRLGTTRGTNALITRRGAKTGFVTTRGFGDVLRIGYQDRPRLFDLAIELRSPLFADVLEIDERVTPQGEVLAAPDPDRIRRDLKKWQRAGIESLAICLLNSYCQPRHELLVGEIAREIGFTEIALSHEVAPIAKMVARGDTTVADAYLNPVLRCYVHSLERAMRESEIRLLTSAGGLVSPDRFRGKDSILSGPAGGVVGFSRVAQAAGFERAIGFDMGGTSTDVSRFDGQYQLEYETEKAGVRIVAPMMAIETVAAGGGSICRFDGVKLAVGPESAGAEPGPASYGRGGPLSVTDINLFLGKLRPEHFPFPLDYDAVRQQLESLAAEIEHATGRRFTDMELADGFLTIANTNMASAIRSISVSQGFDPRDYVMVAFGGAAPQHACAVAGELGIRTIINHPDAGILSAYGIGLADVVRHASRGIYRRYSDQAIHELNPIFEELTDLSRREVMAEGIEADRIETIRQLDLRYCGVDACLTIPEVRNATYSETYVAEHQRLYGYVHENRPLEIVAAKVIVTGRAANQLPPSVAVEEYQPAAESEGTVFFEQQPHTVPVFRRADLKGGAYIDGPAMVVEAVSTTIIDPGWTAEMFTGGELVITRRQTKSQTTAALSTEDDPVMLEIFNNQFTAIADRMGITLRNTSSSVNVKERLDFSCALFTPSGDLVVNAPHIPVHLGAMSETVKGIIADNPAMRPGDVFVTNDPYRGGSHLPDVTVVTPVHDSAADRILFFTASRAHHAEIGGIAPGSMPPFSRTLAEEGVLISNFKLVDSGVSREAELRQLLTTAAYPTRNVADNIADIAAQVAANRQGASDLLALVKRYSMPVVTAYMRYIQNAAETKMKAALSCLPNGRHTFDDHLDGGETIAVAVTIDGSTAVIDFTGTSAVMPGNLNATPAIVTAAVIYCLRCIIGEDIPLNQGVLAPVKIVLPECLLNPPNRNSPGDCAAVAGGNVETSQRIADVLLGALQLAGASQGTMNNVLFGDDTFGYYETICGGAGATSERDGADAVHTHMTNTRLTDPEVIEQRFPVRVREFSIRHGSGGAGMHRGGNGVIRQLEFLKPLEVSVLSQRRGSFAPYGIRGGEAGALGKNSLIRRDGTQEILGAQSTRHVEAGDILVIETPGGGGFGG